MEKGGEVKLGNGREEEEHRQREGGREGGREGERQRQRERQTDRERERERERERARTPKGKGVGGPWKKVSLWVWCHKGSMTVMMIFGHFFPQSFYG